MPPSGDSGPQYVTLQDIADRAKVSCTTVSLALRNHPKISVATRRKIARLAKTMGYRVNPLVSAHMSYLRTRRPLRSGLSIGFVCNRPLADIMADTKRPHRHYYKAAEARARELGFELPYFDLSEPGMTERRLSQIMEARGIPGMVIAPLTDGLGVTDINFKWDNFATVAIDHTFITPRLHKVCNDEFSTIGRLIQLLLVYGHERIGIAMHSRMDDHANHFWLAGYEAFQKLSHPRNRIDSFITENWDEQSFMAWYQHWRPEAIITINDDILKWLKNARVKVPTEVSCVTLYWKEDRPHLSGFYPNHEFVAAGAIDLVVSQMHRNERGLPANEKTMLIQAAWEAGKTLSRKTPADYVAPLRVWTR